MGQWVKLIADELKEYPQIGFRWKEAGLSFQVQFMKLNYVSKEKRQELGQELANPTKYSEILQKLMVTPLARKEISEAFGEKQISGQLNRILPKLITDRLIDTQYLKIKIVPTKNSE